MATKAQTTEKELKDLFKERYKNLNKEQKEAVDTIEGPVMVVAGPGTGKTEILTLRIANILKKTDTPASGILALTFTNSGVRAMRQRLLSLIGSEASGVNISTFHSFAISLIQEFYDELNFPVPPRLMDDNDRIVLFDELLENNPWQYLRTRSGGAHNFNDLRSVISLLKQDRISPNDFSNEIDSEIFRIQNDPASISSRGATKGELKASEKEKIERFERTKEIAQFYGMYEAVKKERNLSDYDDVLEYAVELVKKSDNARATLKERYLYVLVDEHQDSSGVQNDFIEEVWGDVEQPNVFAVGDDRQLIYEFGGASMEHFERFQKVFKGTKLITLVQNHRSTQIILDTADRLLQSKLADAKLKSQKKENYSLKLVEAEYPRDEILAAALEIKEKIDEGIPANECAILVPKNAQVKSATAVLADLGLPVASGGKISFFSLALTQSLIRLLRAMSDPYAPDRLATVLLDSAFGVPFLISQRFLRENGHKLSLESMHKADPAILSVALLIEGLASEIPTQDVYGIIQKAAQELFFKNTTTNAALTLEVEIVRTMLHIALGAMEKNHKITLEEFLALLSRLEEYGQDISLAVFGGEEGVQVRTLHTSKGLEFDWVWIAHLDESSLMKGKQLTVTLPEKIKARISKKDELSAKRELYVGITRAKRFCSLSYAKSGYTGGTQYLANIVAELPENSFEKISAKQTEDMIRKENELAYVESTKLPPKENTREEIMELVKEHFTDRPVSVTHLNNFFSCPWKWYFRNFLLLPEPVTESLEFGNVVHKSIEALLKEGLKQTTVEKVLDNSLDEERIYEEKKRARYVRDGLSVLQNFVDHYYEEFVGSYSERKPNSYRDPKVPEVEVTGKIDALQNLPNGTLAVTDFKTGRVKSAREIEKRGENGRMSDMLRQLAMYSYLLIHDKYVRQSNVSVSQLLFLEAEWGDKNALYKTEITSEHIDLLRKDLQDYVELLSTGKWMDCECDFHPYGSQKECEYCAFAENLKLKTDK